MKNNPLVSTLAEAAGDCLDQRGCQEAAKKVVKLMTVVHVELEKKRLKELEETKSILSLYFVLLLGQHVINLISNSIAQQLAHKQEEDRAKERARQEKKAEKDKRRAESNRQQAAHQAAAAASHKSAQANSVKTEMSKSEKKSQRQQQQQKQSKHTISGNFSAIVEPCSSNNFLSTSQARRFASSCSSCYCDY